MLIVVRNLAIGIWHIGIGNLEEHPYRVVYGPRATESCYHTYQQFHRNLCQSS